MFVASSSSHIKTPSKSWRMLTALAYATLAALLMLQPELAMAQLEKATSATQALKDLSLIHI